MDVPLIISFCRIEKGSYYYSWRRRSRKEEIVVFVCIVYHLLTSLCWAGEPPLIQDGYQRKIRVLLGEPARLTCPITSADSSELIFDWSKEGEPFPSPGEIRVRQIGPQLRIDKTELSDSGPFVCRAVNGYGSQDAEIRLKVRDPSSIINSSDVLEEDDDDVHPSGDPSDVSYVPVEEFDDLSIEGLNFTADTLRQPRHLRITTGSSMDIHCAASGYPSPHLVWLKDGREWIGRGPSVLEDPDGWRSVSRLSLELRSVGPEAAGNYTCLARGVKQKIEVNFSIEILDMKKKLVKNLTELMDPPNNTTELRGGKARFHCWLRGPIEPHAEWLKKLPPAPYRGQINTNTSLIVGDDQYQTLRGAEKLVRKEDGSYWKSLILDPLHETDAGTYLCLGINPSGFNMEKAILNIKLNYENRETKSVPLSIMVALPSALILSIAGGFVCWVRERDRERRQDMSAAAAIAGNRAVAVHHPPINHHQVRPSLMSGSSHHHHHPMEETVIETNPLVNRAPMSGDVANKKRTGRVSVSTTASNATTMSGTNNPHHYFEPPL